MNKGKASNVSKIEAIFIYIAVSFFLFFEMGVQVSPSVMANELMQDLGISAFGLGLMSSFYFYTYTFMQIPSGLLFDRYNPRKIIPIAIVICSLGVLLFAKADSLLWGSLARMLMGFGSAFAFISVLVVASDLFENKYFALMTGITQMLAALGAMTGQLPIRLIITWVGWRQTLMILSVIGIFLALLIWKLLRYEKNEHLHFEVKPNLSSGLKIIMGNQQSWYIAIYACLLWAPMSGFASLWGVPFLEKVNHLNQNSAAFVCSMMWLGLAIGSPLLGSFSNFFRNNLILLQFSSFLGCVAFLPLFFFQFSSWELGLLLAFAGAACSGQAFSFAIVRENNTDSLKGVAMAFNNMAVVISGSIFQPLMGKLISFTSFHNNPVYSYKLAGFCVLLAYFVALMISLFCIKKTAKI